MTHYRHTGTVAEYLSINASLIARKPNNLTHAEAASLPLVSITCYQGLFNYAKVQPGQIVLVLGASGGTGTAAVQLAHAAGKPVGCVCFEDIFVITCAFLLSIGAHVIATCGARNAKLVASLGADEVIDYRTENVWKRLSGRKIDAVLDCVGGAESWVEAQKVLPKSGHSVTIVGDKESMYYGVSDLLSKGAHKTFRSIAGALRIQPSYHLILADPNGRELAKIASLVERGQLKPVVEKEYDLADTVEAFETLMAGHVTGKLVINMTQK